MHISQNLALLLIQTAEFLTLQELDVSVQNRQRSLQIVGRRSKSVRSAQVPLAKLRVFLQLRDARGLGFPRGRTRFGYSRPFF